MIVPSQVKLVKKGFAGRHTAPRISDKNNLELTMIVDNSSIELFADNGLSVMTDIFFPNQLLSDVKIQSPSPYVMKTLQYSKMKSIWK